MSKPVRPPAVTSACLFLGLICLLLLWYVISWLSSWNSLEIQEGIRDALRSADLDALGISADSFIDTLRIVLMVMVVPLIAGVVFAVFAARGDRQSRIMLSIVAGFAAVSFALIGGLLGLLPAAFVVVSMTQLWGADARRWFAVVNGLPAPAAPAHPTVAAPVQQPDPFAAGATATTSAVPAATPATRQPQSTAPRPIRTILLVTTISASIASLFCALYLAVFLIARDTLIEAQLDSPMREMMDSTDAELMQAMRIAAATCATVLVLSAAAAVSVVLLMRRRRAGHVALMILSLITVALGVFTLVGLPWAGAAVWVVVLLFRPESRQWVDPARG